MDNNTQKGQRLLASVIDAHAINDPKKVWAVVPVNNEDLTKGYRDITYRKLATAINHAAWWLKETITGDDGFVSANKDFFMARFKSLSPALRALSRVWRLLFLSFGLSFKLTMLSQTPRIAKRVLSVNQFSDSL